MESVLDILSRTPLHPLLEGIGRLADSEGLEAYVVGGAVRDALLGRPTTDLDFVTLGPGSGIQLANRVADEFGVGQATVYPQFGTAAVRLSSPDGSHPDFVLEFVGARKESYRRESRKPIVEEGTLADDLKRRDFTINAMAVRLSVGRLGELVDPFGGREDLAKRLIRTPLEPEATFADDPLRIIRAVRFAVQLDFRIAPPVLRAMRETAARVSILSQERIVDELARIICCPVPSKGFRLLHGSGVLQLIFPELAALEGVEAVGGRRHKDNFFHTLQVLDNLVEMTASRDCESTYWLRWAAILHDIGKPETKRYSAGTGWTFHGHQERGARMIPRIFRRFRLPLDERLKYVQKMVRLHHRPVSLVDDEVTDSAVRRLLFDAGDDIDDLMVLVRADITSKNPRRVRRYLDAFDRVEEKLVEVEEKDRLRAFQPPLDGNEIMETLGLGPGRCMGDLKEAIRDAILDGRIPNDHDAAYDYLMRIKDEIISKGER
jgi:poly(A) polymerase